MEKGGHQGAETALRQLFDFMDRAFVAFSAGVDSTYLLTVAHQQMGERVQAVIADSPSLNRRSLDEARVFCRERGIILHEVPTDEFNDDNYVNNTGLRCYACKAALFRSMGALTTNLDLNGAELCLGAVTDDFEDIRPGMRAAQEAGARWPLVEAGMSKAMVRAASRALKLPTWDRPAQPCLSSRIPYGETVTAEALSMVEQAENWLRDAGMSDCRARHHAIGGNRGSLCRVEVPDADIDRLVALRKEAVTALKAIGYQQVALDLAGLASGGFNSLLDKQEQDLGRITVSGE